ncbi:MAG: hypothetical protein V4534_09125 [Myxococcota bacterium]
MKFNFLHLMLFVPVMVAGCGDSPNAQRFGNGLAEAANAAKDGTVNTFNDAKDKTAEAATQANDKAKDIAGEAKNKADAFWTGTQDRGAHFKNMVVNAKNAARDTDGPLKGDANKVGEAVNDATDSINARAAKAQDRAKEFNEDVKQTWQSVKDDVNNKVSKANKDLKKVAADGQKFVDEKHSELRARVQDLAKKATGNKVAVAQRDVPELDVKVGEVHILTPEVIDAMGRQDKLVGVDEKGNHAAFEIQELDDL